MLRNGIRVLLSAVLVTAFVTMASGQGPWHWKISLEGRIRGETRNNKDFSDGAKDHRGDELGRARVGLQVTNPDEGVTLFLQPQESYDQFWTATRNDNDHYIDTYQAYGEWLQPESKLWMVRAGRQEFSLGEKRMLGSSWWGNFGRSYDGLRLDYHRGDWTVTGFGGTVGSFGHNPAHPGIYVVQSQWLKPAHTLETYYILKHTPQGIGNDDVSSLGIRYVVPAKVGFDIRGEAIGQFGKNGGKDIQAAGAYVIGGYTFGCDWSPRIGFEAAYASGGDPSDSKVKTFEPTWPVIHEYYGVSDLQGWRNARIVRVDATAKPAKCWTMMAQYLFFNLDNTKDAWYSTYGIPNVGAGGVVFRDPTGAAGRDVGREFDFVLTFNPCPTWTFQAGVGRFFPGNFIKAINGAGDNQDYGYLMAVYRY
jgi:hypothetical protein